MRAIAAKISKARANGAAELHGSLGDAAQLRLAGSRRRAHTDSGALRRVVWHTRGAESHR